jgi:hypothetical protein
MLGAGLTCALAGALTLWTTTTTPPPAPPPPQAQTQAPAPAPAAPPVSAVATEMNELREMVRQLQRQVKELQARPIAAPPPAMAPATAPPPSSVVVAAPPADKPSEPFAFADWGWLNGNSRQTEFPLDGPVFSAQFMLDGNWTYSFAQPIDHTLVGSTTSGRHDEFQLSHLGFGGDLHWKNIRGRLMTQFGLYSTMTPRNDSSPSRGQWDLSDAYRYLAEAYGGYHFNVLHGINVDAGIFMSYIGLCSYYDFENWVYQESYVSANTPFFFNGVRLQIFPSETLKIEPWIINGWQSYGTFNEMPGFGVEVLWRPHVGWFSFVSNDYFGSDSLYNYKRYRYHSDNSVQVRYWNKPDSLLGRAAFSLTFDLGCENGGGVSCFAGSRTSPSQYFVGFMFYNRLWFWHDRFGLTNGVGAVTNPGRYLVLLPPINGASAASGTPYFTLNPGDSFKAWDTSTTLDYMPSQFYTLRFEFIHRETNIPYFAGHGGVTPPGGNQGAPGSLVSGWAPDLVNQENRVQVAVMIRF